jgi:high-affinity nickel permease
VKLAVTVIAYILIALFIITWLSALVTRSQGGNDKTGDQS